MLRLYWHQCWYQCWLNTDQVNAVSVYLCCVLYIPPVSSNSRLVSASATDITSSMHISPLLLPCSALFYSPPPRDSAALKQTHARWPVVSESPMTEEKWSIVWSYFTASQSAACGGRPFTTVTIPPLCTNAWKALFISQVKSIGINLLALYLIGIRIIPHFPKISHP